MNSKQNRPFWGLAVLISGIIIFGLMLILPKDKKYVYYDVPTYTTVYDIVYPDSTYRYTAVHHSPSRLSCRKGSNCLYSKRHYKPLLLFDRERPDYWVDEWNNSELNIETTAPIRIVSETVTHKKVRYMRK